MKNLSAFAEKYAATPTLGYTHYQPAQPVTVGKRAALWLQDLLSDLDFVLGSLRFLGCRGTTGTEASFMDLFDGDEAKIDEMNRRIAAEFGLIWFWNPSRREQWQYTAEESGETGAALLRIWRGNMVLVIVSLAVMAVLVWMG